jgi:hypothetical protein
MKTLVLNSSNADRTDPNNSRYIYRFPAGGASLAGKEIAVAAISLYYSWFNISDDLNNRRFDYVWYSGAGPTATVVNVNVPAGFYTAAQLNAYLQSVMIANKHYLISSTGDFIYFLEFVENPTAYAIQFNSYALPTSADATAFGWTTPAGWPGFVTTKITPQLTILNNNFKDIIGFNIGTYPTPTLTSDYSKISDYTPQFSPVQSVLLRCNVVNNRLSNPADIIYSFAPVNVDFGSIISPAISEFIWNSIDEGQNQPEFIVQFLDQSFKPLPIRDTNLVIVLSIRDKQDQFLRSRM